MFSFSEIAVLRDGKQEYSGEAMVLAVTLATMPKKRWRTQEDERILARYAGKKT